MGLVGWYRSTISPKNPGKCKYYPTCSTYMVIAVKRFGAIRGGLLGILRLLRCQPWVDGGIDDVPHRFSLFYRFRWSKAHEEVTLEPIVTLEEQLK
ncbi:MAG: membrane protein insertion efficiency factor YidD [Aeriscardovia aeriphila]|nr:membrane protein insertion efficiency factor YidD [Aeriscardovia aeriphila]